MMKKTLIALAVAGLSISLLAGCQPNDAKTTRFTSQGTAGITETTPNDPTSETTTIQDGAPKTAKTIPNGGRLPGAGPELWISLLAAISGGLFLSSVSPKKKKLSFLFDK